MEIKTTEIFEKSLVKLYKKDKHLLDTLEELIEVLQNNSSLGISLGNGRYKIRMKNRSNNKGKSGGYRVITYTNYTLDKITQSNHTPHLTRPPKTHYSHSPPQCFYQL